MGSIHLWFVRIRFVGSAKNLGVFKESIKSPINSQHLVQISKNRRQKCLSWLTSYSIKRELPNFEFLQNFKHFFFSTERVKKNLSNSKITPLEIIFRSQCIYLKVNLKLKLPGHCRSLNSLNFEKLLDRLAHLCHFLDEKKS